MLKFLIFYGEGGKKKKSNNDFLNYDIGLICLMIDEMRPSTKPDLYLLMTTTPN